MNALHALIIYTAAKTVTVVVEEAFCPDRIKDEDVVRLKVCAIFYRYVSYNARLAIHSIWNNLPLGIAAYCIDENDFLFSIGRCILIDVMHRDFPPMESVPLMNLLSPKLLAIVRILGYTVLIIFVRMRGVRICNNLQPRVPLPVSCVLERLKKTLRFEPLAPRMN